MTREDGVADFADYRVRMRAGPPADVRSYYLAGLTHGVRRGGGADDAEPRRLLADAIRAHHPHTVVHDPVAAWYGADRPAMPEPARLAEFHRLTGLAASSEVCVAWLPDRDAITDSVAELQAARCGGGTVVVITGEADDFLVRAFASVVLPDVAAFADWLPAAA
ncbi:MAG TPA: hypothetical protein VGP26_17180 [Actinophytocola sp.]|jgi:hypothetical protein|nr:hypothetical protein [Actinophytocola sp.]